MIFILFALLNGALIAIARALNGRLAVQKNALYASWINHLVGFVALTGVLLLAGLPTGVADVPPLLFFGGAIGALYVSLNSYIVPKLGVTMATLLVIAGQMVMSLLLDLWLGKLPWVFNLPMLLLLTGCLLLVFGFYQLLRAR
ncbi:DMT family transporter [Reinekea marinisedimentorum]|uniref:Transporter family-2 protein n=1 Tax=Reinekea marinisedimentorum TaxID=230495 RepID=A0A4R3IBX4_9GAMM|nr:DMT family transporter [Reinekea marinisedimentorum]TCS44001.1 transporter family-2 protein [Reinekea marinisedimentorum]